MAYCVKIGRLNVGGGQALLKIVGEETAELATHDGYIRFIGCLVIPLGDYPGGAGTRGYGTLD